MCRWNACVYKKRVIITIYVNLYEIHEGGHKYPPPAIYYIIQFIPVQLCGKTRAKKFNVAFCVNTLYTLKPKCV